MGRMERWRNGNVRGVLLKEACELLSSRNIARGLRRRGARRQSVRRWRNEGSELPGEGGADETKQAHQVRF